MDDEVIEAYNKNGKITGIYANNHRQIINGISAKIDMFTAAFQKIAHNDVYITTNINSSPYLTSC